jgi:hypothetical protein
MLPARRTEDALDVVGPTILEEDVDQHDCEQQQQRLQLPALSFYTNEMSSPETKSMIVYLKQRSG